MQVEAITKTPGVLLLNQSYSRFWRATALPESTQQSYTILPGDYTQIAIPVRAGRHKLTLRYQPSLFPIGAAITSISLIAYLATCLFEWRRRPENPTTHATH
jgi:uncharacterized membrane protein YfhO